MLVCGIRNLPKTILPLNSEHVSQPLNFSGSKKTIKDLPKDSFNRRKPESAKTETSVKVRSGIRKPRAENGVGYDPGAGANESYGDTSDYGGGWQ